MAGKVVLAATLSRLERIAAIVDRELAAIEKELQGPGAEPAPLGRLELLAKLIRQLDLYDDPKAIDDPYAGIPANLLREVMKYAKPGPAEEK